MLAALSQFNRIIQDTKDIGAIFTYLQNHCPTPMDYSDLLRLQWSQAVSAFDKMIHDLVRIGMIGIFNGTRSETPNYKNFAISMDAFEQIKSYPLYASQFFENTIIQKHGFLSFQSPEKVAEALSYIWAEPHKWQHITLGMGKPASDEQNIKTTLNNIVIRRNQIVHEGDFQSSLMQRQPILYADVESVILFIEQLANSIYTLVR